MPVKKYEFNIAMKDSGKRLDMFLKDSLADHSRNKIKKVIDSGGAYVNRKRQLIASYLLQDGDYVEFYDDIKEDGIKFGKGDIVFEDDYILAINKPPNIPTQSTYSSIKGTILEIVEDYYKSKGEKQYVRLIHRLDKGTSGVLILSKNPQANGSLTAQFREKDIRKEYIALVAGNLKVKSGTIKTNISKVKGSYTKYENVLSDGKQAISDYEVIEVLNGYSLVLVKPRTGRTHQIRVHLSSLGHPILGDELYGGRCRALIQAKDKLHDINVSRVMLHARSVTLKHPKNGKTVQICADIPQDMKKIISLLK